MCHNRGKCDPETGQCQCAKGFTGSRCACGAALCIVHVEGRLLSHCKCTAKNTAVGANQVNPAIPDKNQLRFPAGFHSRV